MRLQTARHISPQIRLMVLVLSVIGCPGLASSLTPDEQFTLKTFPILQEKCFSCHGENPDKIKGELNLLTREGFLTGGEYIDNLLVPGKPDESFLMTVIRWEDDEYEMPPKENDRLTPEQIEQIETWIQNGAPWPNEEARETILLAERTKEVTEDGVIIKTSGGTSDEWTYRRYKPEDIWAFQPVKKPSVPGHASHPVDAFILRRLAGKKVEPAPRAESRTLLRRLSHAVTGLPPTPEQLTRWMALLEEDFGEGYGEIVDELLASPHYGEHWAQHWLDVARYADTAGFSNDFEMSNAWRYRDYVVRSFNNDLPYNRFVLEQIAGDELQPGNPETTIATGFLRMGPWEHTGMLPADVSRQTYLDDVVDSVGQTFLSTAMSCFKCHDHKFDPLPTRDYYRMYAAFAGTNPAEVPASFLPGENRSTFANDRDHVQDLLEFSKKEQDRLYAKREAAAKAWYKERDLPYKNLQARKDDPDDSKPARFVGLTTTDEGQLKVREQDVKIWTRRLERFQPLAQSVYNGKRVVQNSTKLRPPKPHQKKQEPAAPPQSFILAGGSIHATADPVTPGVLSALRVVTTTGQDPYALPTEWEGRRLALAKWIARPDNPLTTRSIVNRVWAHHFGTGIAGNPNNFGATGRKPTHPELLDHLASEFVENGWSFKHLHRLILTSETWRQASTHPEINELRKVDPNNDLLAYFPPRRLTAEELRDSILRITGELNPTVGGLPARPEINREVALSPRMIQFSLAPAYQPNKTPSERNRRSIYAYRIRGLVDPLMEVFNKPNADASCEHRDAPSVTPQVFTLLNSEVITNRSIAFALRLEEEAPTPAAQIDRAYELALLRKPTDSERESLIQHYQEMLSHHKDHHPEAVTYPTEITRSLVEEFSGEPFEYTEFLDIYTDYTPDPLPVDQTPEIRALADICLLLFNSNELMFVY